MFGLKNKDIEFIINVVQKYPEIKAVGIFGSRAMECYRGTSDIDIVLYGETIDFDIINEVEEVLENQSPYPFYVDVKHYESIRDNVFINEVNKSVKIIYKI